MMKPITRIALAMLLLGTLGCSGCRSIPPMPGTTQVAAWQKAYRALNSWGTEWGQDGRFWVRQDDMRALLEDLAGEASSAIETAAS